MVWRAVALKLAIPVQVVADEINHSVTVGIEIISQHLPQRVRPDDDGVDPG